jgi:hypothetical protein
LRMSHEPSDEESEILRDRFRDRLGELMLRSSGAALVGSGGEGDQRGSCVSGSRPATGTQVPRKDAVGTEQRPDRCQQRTQNMYACVSDTCANGQQVTRDADQTCERTRPHRDACDRTIARNLSPKTCVVGCHLEHRHCSYRSGKPWQNGSNGSFDGKFAKCA